MADLRPTKPAVRPEATEKQDSPDEQKQIQIHAGNTSVLTVQVLSEINQKLGRIADSFEHVIKAIKETNG